jgi:hypothetical protein
VESGRNYKYYGLHHGRWRPLQELGDQDVAAIRRGRLILAPLPLYLLGGSPEFARILDLWGIRTFGQFANLPPLGVAARLGDEGVHLRQKARGEDYRQLRLLFDPLLFREEKELEHAVDLLEPLSGRPHARFPRCC